MSWADMFTFTVALLGTLECIAGRLAAMHLSEHRPSYLLGYFAASGVCILAASMTWQQMDVRWLDWAAWSIGLHLALTWGDWRHGAPLEAFRGRPMHAGGELAPSTFDDGRR